MSMGPRLQLSRNGKIVGEYDIEKLRMMKEEGRIFPGDYLWMNGWADWKDALGYLGTQKTPEKTEETSKPKRSRPKNQRKRAEVAAEAAETEGSEEQDIPPGEAKVRSHNTIANKIGVFSLILMVLIFGGYRRGPPPPPKPRETSATGSISQDGLAQTASQANPERTCQDQPYRDGGRRGQESKPFMGELQFQRLWL